MVFFVSLYAIPGVGAIFVEKNQSVSGTSKLFISVEGFFVCMKRPYLSNGDGRKIRLRYFFMV